MKTFNDLRGGDTVKFRVRNGTSTTIGKNGSRKTTVEWAVRVAQVNPLLCFEKHVVVNHGNNGTVVDASNFISQVIV